MSSLNITKSHQELVVASLIRDQYMYAMAKDSLDDTYFSDPNCRIIYKAVSNYYRKYRVLPQISEISVLIGEAYSEGLGTDLNSVQEELKVLTNLVLPENDQYIKDKIIDLIRRVRTGNVFSTLLAKVKSNDTLDNDELMNSLYSSMEVDLSTEETFVLSNVDQVIQNRQKVLGNSDKPRIIKSSIDSINKSLMYGGYESGSTNMIVAAPGTGKTTFLVNEGSYAALQGHYVLTVFIGDMKNYDGFVRYAACISGNTQNNIAMMPEDQFSGLITMIDQQYDNVLSRIHILTYPPDELTADELIETVTRIERKLNVDYDMIIVDYPENLKTSGRSLYEEGGDTYNKLNRLFSRTASVGLVASQPKPAYWSQEIIPLEGAAESSKKQHSVDTMISMGKPTRDSEVGSFFLAKVRRGVVGRVIRFQSLFTQSRFQEIPEATYRAHTQKVGS